MTKKLSRVSQNCLDLNGQSRYSNICLKSYLGDYDSKAMTYPKNWFWSFYSDPEKENLLGIGFRSMEHHQHVYKYSNEWFKNMHKNVKIRVLSSNTLLPDLNQVPNWFFNLRMFSTHFFTIKIWLSNAKYYFINLFNLLQK